MVAVQRLAERDRAQWDLDLIDARDLIRSALDILERIGS